MYISKPFCLCLLAKLKGAYTVHTCRLLVPIKDLPDGQEQDLWLDLQDPKEKVGVSCISLVQYLPKLVKQTQLAAIKADGWLMLPCHATTQLLISTSIRYPLCGSYATADLSAYVNKPILQPMLC